MLLKSMDLVYDFLMIKGTVFRGEKMCFEREDMLGRNRPVKGRERGNGYKQMENGSFTEYQNWSYELIDRK